MANTIAQKPFTNSAHRPEPVKNYASKAPASINSATTTSSVDRSKQQSPYSPLQDKKPISSVPKSSSAATDTQNRSPTTTASNVDPGEPKTPSGAGALAQTARGPNARSAVVNGVTVLGNGAKIVDLLRYTADRDDAQKKVIKSLKDQPAGTARVVTARFELYGNNNLNRRTVYKDTSIGEVKPLEQAIYDLTPRATITSLENARALPSTKYVITVYWRGAEGGTWKQEGPSGKPQRVE